MKPKLHHARPTSEEIVMRFAFESIYHPYGVRRNAREDLDALSGLPS